MISSERTHTIIQVLYVEFFIFRFCSRKPQITIAQVGLAFWEDNMITWLNVMDPMSDLVTFMKTGNIFFPIPGTPALIMKPFQIWGIPWMFPTAMVRCFRFRFSFFISNHENSNNKPGHEFLVLLCRCRRMFLHGSWW